MRWLQRILSEIWGLFVDDGIFAVSILVWLVVVGFAARYWHAAGLTVPPWLAITLALGLAAILLESTTRFARKKRSSR